MKNLIIIPEIISVLPYFSGKRNRVKENKEFEIDGIKFKINGLNEMINQPGITEMRLYHYILDKLNIQESLEFDIKLLDLEKIGVFSKIRTKKYEMIDKAFENLKRVKFSIDDGEKHNLLNYKRVRVKNRVYYKIRLSKFILMQYQQNILISLDKDLSYKLLNKDTIAFKIYSYLRAMRIIDEIDVELAGKISGINLTKINKIDESLKYKTKNYSYIRKRVSQAFDLLKKMEIIQSYKIENNKIKFVYKNKKLEFSKSDLNPEISKLKESDLKTVSYKDSMVEYNRLNMAIHKAKKNIYFSKNYNEHVYNYLLKIYEEKGTDFVDGLLSYVYDNLKKDLTVSLKFYLNKLVKKDQFDIIKKDIRKNKEPKIAMNKNDLKLSLDKIKFDYLKIFNNFDAEYQKEILEKAKRLYEIDTDVSMNNINEKIFNQDNIKSYYIKKALEEIYQS